MKILSMFSLVAAGLLLLSVPSAQAFPTSSAPVVAPSHTLMETVANKSHNHQIRRSWDRHRDGRRCTSRSNYCRHYYHGYWYQNPWWTLPLIGGSIILNSQHHHLSGRHVAWCEDHYRSYNRRTNTWVAYSGAVRQCYSPYGP